MHQRTRRLLSVLTLAIVASAPLAGPAQTQKFYRTPKIVAMGTHVAAVSGKGSVDVKVFIKKNGSVASAVVVKSTNSADNAAALQIAKSSKYRPGSLDGVPGDFFYTVALTFNGASVTSGDSTASAGGGMAGGSSALSQARSMIRSGNYSGAKSTLSTYLASHADDKDAQALLGVADTYLEDPTSAAVAFDAAGTVPANYKVVAIKAYGDAAFAAIKAKNFDPAAAYATKAIALAPNDFNLLYLRGSAYANGQRFPEATADLEKSKALAATSNAPEKTRLLIDESLASSYLLGGQTDKGLALARDIKKRDPNNTSIGDAIAAAYGKQAATLAADGKRDEAVAAYESAAAAVPAHAATYYSAAAGLLANATKPDWKIVRAEADKGLASDPTFARGNFIAGVAAANSGDKAAALVYLQKAKANAGTDTALSAQVDTALKSLGQK